MGLGVCSGRDWEAVGSGLPQVGRVGATCHAGGAAGAGLQGGAEAGRVAKYWWWWGGRRACLLLLLVLLLLLLLLLRNIP